MYSRFARRIMQVKVVMFYYVTAFGEELSRSWHAMQFTARNYHALDTRCRLRRRIITLLARDAVCGENYHALGIARINSPKESTTTKLQRRLLRSRVIL